MQIGDLKTGKMYRGKDVPKKFRRYLESGLVEILRDGNGDKVGLVDITRKEGSSYWYFEDESNNWRIF